MAIELVKVTDDLRSVLVLNEQQLEEYRNFLKSLKWLRESKTTMSEETKKTTKEKLESFFLKIFKEYFKRIGLKTDHWQSQPSLAKVYLKPNNIIEISFKDIKIVPDKDMDLPNYGFSPEMNFFINPENPSEIEVASRLKREGLSLLVYLIKPTLLYYPPSRNRLNSLIVKPGIGGRYLAIASIEQISPFLEQMKLVYRFLGKRKLEKLAMAEKAMLQTNPELKEVATAFYALTLLRCLGKETEPIIPLPI